MINQIYQLTAPKVITVKYQDISYTDKVIVKPEYMALCHADQRYFLGQRDTKVLRQKLPMALIHECCGRVLYDPENKLTPGQRVVMIPNVPGDGDPLIFENYQQGSRFLSSGFDGFMREMVEMPRDRVVKLNSSDMKTAAITEFLSVAVHACTRFGLASHAHRDRIGIWGDGSLAYAVACVLRQMYPDSQIIVVGKEPSKLRQFSFAHETHIAGDFPKGFYVDHAFECCGGEGSFFAIADIIDTIHPQGTLMLMGVSENKVAINTRMVLEKGLTMVGCSRSGRADFEKAVSFLEQPDFRQRLKVIIYDAGEVHRIDDIYRVFAEDLTTPFKTVFRWML